MAKVRVGKETATRIDVDQVGPVDRFRHRRVATHDGLFPRCFCRFQMSTPPEEYHGIILLHILGHGQVGSDSGVDEQKIIRFMIEQRLAHKGDVRLRKDYPPLPSGHSWLASEYLR